MSEFIRLQAEKKILLNNIVLARRKENKVLTKKYKTWIRTLDFLIILAVLGNIGAYFITNTLVVRDTPDVEFKEANPVMAAREGFATTPEANSMFWGLLTQLYLLAGMVAFGVWYRTHLVSYWGLWSYSLVVSVMTTFLLFDFLNDLSLLIGVGLW